MFAQIGEPFSYGRRNSERKPRSSRAWFAEVLERIATDTLSDALYLSSGCNRRQGKRSKRENELRGFRLDYLHDSLIRGGLEGT